MTSQLWRAFPPRQITGRPFSYYGYVGRDRIERHCHTTPLSAGAGPGEHRGADTARRCAERAARRLNRKEAP